jgi:hypothetical protein
MPIKDAFPLAVRIAGNPSLIGKVRFARDSGPMFKVPDTCTSMDVVTGTPSKETFAQCY